MLTSAQEKQVYLALAAALLAVVGGIVRSYFDAEVVYSPISILICVFAAGYANGGFRFLGAKPRYGIGLMVVSGISLLMLKTPWDSISALPFIVWFIACYWA